MVPAELKADVWAHYRAGQEVDKRPSPKWHQAATRAIRAVAELEADAQAVADAADQQQELFG